MSGDRWMVVILAVWLLMGISVVVCVVAGTWYVSVGPAFAFAYLFPTMTRVIAEVVHHGIDNDR